MEIKKIGPKADPQIKRDCCSKSSVHCARTGYLGVRLHAEKEHRIQQIDTSYGPVEEQITEITRQDRRAARTAQENRGESDRRHLGSGDQRHEDQHRRGLHQEFTENAEIEQIVAVEL